MSPPFRDLQTIVAIVADEATDLRAAVPSCPEHTALREALIAADHNADRIGEMRSLRQVANACRRGHDNGRVIVSRSSNTAVRNAFSRESLLNSPIPKSIVTDYDVRPTTPRVR